MPFSSAFDDALILSPLGHDNHELVITPTTSRTIVTARTTDAYHNMIGPHGGISAAVLLHAVASREDIQGQPLSLTVHYVKVVSPGEYTIITELIGSTRTTQHFSISAWQNGVTVLQGLALWGVLRPLDPMIEVSFPYAGSPDDWEEDDLILPWSKNYEFRFAKGGVKQLLNSANPDPSDLLDQAAPQTHSLCWIRNNPPRALDFPAIAALADSFVPRAMLRYRQMVAVSTVSFTTYFHATPQALEHVGDDYVLTDAQAIHFGQGWYDHIGYIWSRDGILLATTTQMAYYKPPA